MKFKWIETSKAHFSNSVLRGTNSSLKKSFKNLKKTRQIWKVLTIFCRIQRLIRLSFVAKSGHTYQIWSLVWRIFWGMNRFLNLHLNLDDLPRPHCWSGQMVRTLLAIFFLQMSPPKESMVLVLPIHLDFSSDSTESKNVTPNLPQCEGESCFNSKKLWFLLKQLNYPVEFFSLLKVKT